MRTWSLVLTSRQLLLWFLFKGVRKVSRCWWVACDRGTGVFCGLPWSMCMLVKLISSDFTCIHRIELHFPASFCVCSQLNNTIDSRHISYLMIEFLDTVGFYIYHSSGCMSFVDSDSVRKLSAFIYHIFTYTKMFPVLVVGNNCSYLYLDKDLQLIPHINLYCWRSVGNFTYECMNEYAWNHYKGK